MLRPNAAALRKLERTRRRSAQAGRAGGMLPLNISRATLVAANPVAEHAIRQTFNIDRLQILVISTAFSVWTFECFLIYAISSNTGAESMIITPTTNPTTLHTAGRCKPASGRRIAKPANRQPITTAPFATVRRLSGTRCKPPKAIANPRKAEKITRTATAIVAIGPQQRRHFRRSTTVSAPPVTTAVSNITLYWKRDTARSPYGLASERLHTTSQPIASPNPE